MLWLIISAGALAAFVFVTAARGASQSQAALKRAGGGDWAIDALAWLDRFLIFHAKGTTTMETVTIRVEGFDFEDVANHLIPISNDENMRIQVKSSSLAPGGLAFDPATIIASGADVLSVLINSLLVYLATRNAGSIAITGGKEGFMVKLPNGTPREEVERYVALARQKDASRLIISST